MARRLRHRTLAAAAAAGLTLAPAFARSASAQARLEVVPSLGLSEEWSDNVRLESDDKESGFTTNVTPRIRIGLADANLTGRLEYGLNARIEHFEEGETDLDHDASVDLAYRVTPRWRLTLRDDFRYSPEPTESLAFVTPGGEAFRRFEQAARQPGVDVLDLRIVPIRQEELRNRLALGTGYDLTSRWTLVGDAIWVMQDSQDEIFGEDSQTLGGRLEAGYRVTPTDDVFLSGGVDRTDFARAPDATLIRGEAGWARQVRETVRFVVAGGYVLVGSDDDGGETTAEDEGEFTARASLSGETARGGWQLAARQEVAAGTGAGDVDRRIVAEAGVSRELTADLGGTLQLRYLRSRSVRDIGAEGSTLEGIAGVTYRFLRWASARAIYRYRRIDPTGPGPSVDENSVLIGVEVLWPLREMPGIRPTP